jgi:hypothetical protein
MEDAMTRKSESGQALVLTALALVVLIGFAGLAIDTGVLRYQKRLQQGAADAAALAGASNLASTSGGITTGAQNASATNGFTDNGGGAVSSCTASNAAVGTTCVQVNNPPLSGPHASNNKYVEALVAVVQPTYFMRIFGVNSEAITARAVATNVSGGANGGGCLYTLGAPAASIEGVNINGNATLNAKTCGINDNGNFNTAGNALTVNAGTFGVSGTCCSAGGTVTCTVTPDSCPTFSTPASVNPFASLTPPAVGAPASFTCPGTGAVPGTYSGITLTGKTNCNFNAGIYILDGGGFTCHGTPTITGTGVMFYLTNGATWDCSGNDTINFTAPSPSNCASCPSQYDGILIYQDPNDTNGPTLGGNTGSTYTGVLYFPTAQVTFSGNSSGINVGIVVADAFALSGHPTVNLEGTAGLPPGVSFLTHAVLVE